MKAIKKIIYYLLSAISMIVLIGIAVMMFMAVK